MTIFFRRTRCQRLSANRPPRPRVRPGPWVSNLGGAALLAGLLWRLGTGPFLAGLRLIDGRALAAALGIGALTTVLLRLALEPGRRRPRGAAAAGHRGGRTATGRSS